jgi:hypothetical protein
MLIIVAILLKISIRYVKTIFFLILFNRMV